MYNIRERVNISEIYHNIYACLFHNVNTCVCVCVYVGGWVFTLLMKVRRIHIRLFTYIHNS